MLVNVVKLIDILRKTYTIASFQSLNAFADLMDDPSTSESQDMRIITITKEKAIVDLVGIYRAECGILHLDEHLSGTWRRRQEVDFGDGIETGSCDGFVRGHGYSKRR